MDAAHSTVSMPVSRKGCVLSPWFRCSPLHCIVCSCYFVPIFFFWFLFFAFDDGLPYVLLMSLHAFHALKKFWVKLTEWIGPSQLELPVVPLVR